MLDNRLGKILRHPVFWIFILALFLRVYKLEEFPVGLHADEVRIGWNALSILKTGKDDRGNKLALYYNTFGDYRPTGIFYVTIPSIAIFGRSELAIRFPSALIGALTVLPLYLFTFQVAKSKKLALLAGFFLAVSPWHIEVSRATSEVVISTFFAIYGLYFFLKGVDAKVKKYLIYSFFLFFTGYFFYHTIRVLAPIFITTVAIYSWSSVKKDFKKNVFAFVGSVFLLTLIFSLSPQARQRMSQVSIFKDTDIAYQYERLKSEGQGKSRLTEKFFHNKTTLIAGRFVKEYGTYFSTDFLIGEKARPYRYTTPGAGLLTFVEIYLFLIGIIQIVRKNQNSLPLFLLLAAPIAAALTTEDTPNLHRAFLMVPFLVVITSYGFEALTSKFLKKVILIFFTLNFAFFLHMYFLHSQIHRPFLNTFELDNPSYRNVGTKELGLKLDKLSRDYEKIVITNFPDEVYPWYAFFTGKDPEGFNSRAIKRYEGPWEYKNIVFSQFKCPSDDSFVNEEAENLLVIDAGYPNCAYQTKIKDGLLIQVKEKITRPDGAEVYVLLERSEKKN